MGFLLQLALGGLGVLKWIGRAIAWFARKLDMQGIIGLAGCLVLGILLILQKGETRNWKKQSGQFEQLYHDEQRAFAQTVANYRKAVEAARAADAANAARVRAEQTVVNQERNDAFEKRVADARARYAASLQRGAKGGANPGGGGTAHVPGLPAGAAGADEATGEGRLPAPDALTATEQAIQLDELIKWVEQQHAIDPNKEPNNAR